MHKHTRQQGQGLVLLPHSCSQTHHVYISVKASRFVVKTVLGRSAFPHTSIPLWEDQQSAHYIINNILTFWYQNLEFSAILYTRIQLFTISMCINGSLIKFISVITSLHHNLTHMASVILHPFQNTPQTCPTSLVSCYKPLFTLHCMAQPEKDKTCLQVRDYQGGERSSLWNVIWCFLFWFRFVLLWCALEFTLTSYMLWATNSSGAAIHFCITAFDGFAHCALIEKLQCLVSPDICGLGFPTVSAVNPNLWGQNASSLFVCYQGKSHKSEICISNFPICISNSRYCCSILPSFTWCNVVLEWIPSCVAFTGELCFFTTMT